MLNLKIQKKNKYTCFLNSFFIQYTSCSFTLVFFNYYKDRKIRQYNNLNKNKNEEIKKSRKTSKLFLS